MTIKIALKNCFQLFLHWKCGQFISKTKKVLFLSDNMAVVEVINKRSSRDKRLMILLRRLVLVSLQCNIHFRAKHIPGKLNVTADKLSRFKFQEAFRESPYIQQQPTKFQRAFFTFNIFSTKTTASFISPRNKKSISAFMEAFLFLG